MAASDRTLKGPEPTQARAKDSVRWTVGAVRALGTTTDLETAAAVLGIGRTKAYELAQKDEFPATVIRVGRRYIVPVPAILRLIEAD